MRFRVKVNQYKEINNDKIVVIKYSIIFILISCFFIEHFGLNKFRIIAFNIHLF